MSMLNDVSIVNEDATPLIDMLVETGLLSKSALKWAEEQTPPGQSVLRTLVAERTLTRRDIAIARSLHLNVPLIDLKHHTVHVEALQLIPEETARRYHAIPMDIIDGELVVVMEDPTDMRAIEDISIRSGRPVRVMLGVREDIEEAYALYYQSQGEIERQLEQITPRREAEETLERLTAEAVTENPVARVVELLLQQAMRDRASDIHIAPGEHHVRIRFRIDGILHDALTVPGSVHESLISRIKVLAQMNIAERRRPQDGQFAFQGPNGPVDVRVATAETSHGEMAVLRLLDKSPSLLKLEELGFLSQALTAYARLYTQPFGMVLVSGPTGAGKTTTLYATINQLNRADTNIITIEDPIEYQFDRVNQLQVNRQAGIDFASGLRSIMRLDPNIILVGEIRDEETARIAVQAALTGHLVFSSIHANDALGTIYRLLDLGIEPYLVGSALAGVVAQRLVRRVCPHCGHSVEPTTEERLAFEMEMGYPPEEIRKGQGCNFCSGTGYRGRTGVFEVLTMTEMLRRMLISDADTDDLHQQTLADGLIDLREDGMRKVERQITTPREVMRNVHMLRSTRTAERGAGTR